MIAEFILEQLRRERVGAIEREQPELFNFRQLSINYLVLGARD